MTYQSQEIVAHATRLYQAGMESELREFIKEVDLADPADDVISWLNQLSLNTEATEDTKLPFAVSARSKGWIAYFNGEYSEALEAFEQSLTDNNWESLASDSALGMAKIYTRSGHWQYAKDWTLYYLALARKLRDDYGLVKGYGALAEIFLRADRPKEALACFQIANQMMPSGQGQLDKQYNYIASALTRNGEYLRAETLLRNSMKLSKDKMLRKPSSIAAQIGFLHSCSRLCYLKLAQNKPLNLSTELQQLLNNVTVHAAKVPAGFINVACTIEAFRHQDIPAQKHYLAKAVHLFTDSAPMELKWVKCMQYQLSFARKLDNAKEQTVKQSDKASLAQKLIQIEPIKAPNNRVTVDITWDKVPLTNSGYHKLQQQDIGLSELMGLWRLFFI